MPPRGENVIVLDEGYWKRSFGGDRGVLGRTIVIGGVTYTIVGVAPQGFTGAELERRDGMGSDQSARTGDRAPTGRRAGTSAGCRSSADSSRAYRSRRRARMRLRHIGVRTTVRPTTRCAPRSLTVAPLRFNRSGKEQRRNARVPLARRGGGDHAAHRLCERRESLSRARDAPPPRGGGPARARHRSRTTDPAARGGERRARPARRCGGSRRRVRGRPIRPRGAAA